MAAKFTKDDSWILGNILSFDSKNQSYIVQDEDDINRVVTIAMADVRKLEDSARHLRRGDKVMAVFPETTMFYKATVAKSPKPPAQGSSNWEVVVKFDDDEDNSGKNPARRVPARFVLRWSEEDGFDGSDGDD